jgi:hypothetical protein
LIFAKTQTVSKKREILFICLAFLLFLVPFIKVLFSENFSFTHDTAGFYGLARFFYNSLMQGVFPYWDPYDYCGQPFYYNLGIMKIFEPQVLALISVFRFTGGHFLLLYNMEFILRILMTCIGVYLCLRKLTVFFLSAFLAFVSFLFSAATYACFGQNGLLTAFCWAPWALWFFLRLRESFSLYNIVGLSLFIGMSNTSYQGGYVLTFFQVFILSLLVTDRAWFVAILRNKRRLLFISIGLVIILMLSLQGIAVLVEKDRSAPIIRRIYEIKKGEIPQEKINTTDLYRSMKADCYRVADLAVPLLPVLPIRRAVYEFTEGWLYIGIVPLLLAVLGMLYAKGRYRMNFSIVTVSFLFLMFNGKNILGPFQYIIFPFLAYARVLLYQPFLILTLVYFVGQGLDVIVTRMQYVKYQV